MKGLLFFVGFIILLFVAMPLVSSLNIDINLKSDYSFRSVLIRVLDGGSNELDSLYPGKTNINGELTTNYSTSLAKIGFSVFILENGEVLNNVEFEEMPTNKPIILDMRADPVDVPENISTSNVSKETTNATIVDEGNLEDGSITAQAISGDEKSFSVPILFYYLIGILLLAGVIGFIVGKMIREKRHSGNISDKPAMIVRKEDSGFSRNLAVAERKLRDAQNEINRLKNTDKIKQAEEKLRRDSEELEKLRKGE
ncbi:hypothetical protein AUJ84_03625 [Candidatus Pacearchaeota archaeon CG1_02_32_132]|nr:MAG: hypothetical protein AUJ84_03625 [Candidatus Pacearchaeota archaeon CG1_02_32_132]